MSTSRRYVFVLGTGRCGSTLVHEVLARHRGTGWFTNLDDRAGRPIAPWPWVGRAYRHLPPAATRKGRVRLAPTEGYRLLERRGCGALVRPVRDLDADAADTALGRRFRDLFERQHDRAGAALLVHKFTGWPRAGFVDRALGAAPHGGACDVRFVHVVRDARAVVNSWLQMPWWDGRRGPAGTPVGALDADDTARWEATGRDLGVLAALGWCALLDAHDRAAAAVGPERWLEVRYEDLLANPPAILEQVRSFVGLAPDRSWSRAVASVRPDPSRLQAFGTELGGGGDAVHEVLRERLDRLGYLDGEAGPARRAAP